MACANKPTDPHQPHNAVPTSPQQRYKAVPTSPQSLHAIDRQLCAVVTSEPLEVGSGQCRHRLKFIFTLANYSASHFLLREYSLLLRKQSLLRRPMIFLPIRIALHSLKRFALLRFTHLRFTHLRFTHLRFTASMRFTIALRVGASIF